MKFYLPKHSATTECDVFKLIQEKEKIYTVENIETGQREFVAKDTLLISQAPPVRVYASMEEVMANYKLREFKQKLKDIINLAEDFSELKKEIETVFFYLS